MTAKSGQNASAAGATATEAAIQPEIRAASIIMRGNFNPLIFRPDWFVQKDLLPAEEVENAIKQKDVDIIHPEIVQFRLSSLTVSVRTDLFSIETNQDPFIRICDLAIGSFSLLAETPIMQLGINMSSHFAVNNQDELNRIGDILTPKTPWRFLLGGTPSKQTGGVRELVMEQSPRLDGRPGRIQVKVEPSAQMKFGVFVAVNDHYDFSAENKGNNATPALKVLQSSFDASIQQASKFSEEIMRLR